MNAGAAPETERASWAQTLLLAIGAMVVAGLIGMSQPLQWLGPRLFDYMSTATPARPVTTDAVVVAIDESSFAQFGQWPWSRSLHARLIRAVRQAGARAIVLDLVFADPSSDTGADLDLAAAMGPDVVLAADKVSSEDQRQTLKTTVLPLQALLDKGATYGFAGLDPDSDGVIRRLPQDPNALTLRALEAVTNGAVAAPPAGALIQYFQPPGRYDTVSYYQALEPQTMLPPGKLRGKVVIIGFSQKTQADIFHRQADSFATAYTIHEGRLTFGAEVHATILDNLSHGLWIRPAPEAMAWIGALLVAFLTAAALQNFQPLRSVIWIVPGVTIILAASFAMLQWGRIWTPPTVPAVALILVAIARTALSFLQERSRRRWVTNAFGHYIAPEMVTRLVHDPQRLSLHGEAREMTFLFCDLRGFTAISERMQDNPEALTHLVNRIMTPLSDCILAEDGTIDKYMGDCVMAFWNAPLNVPDHPVRAVRAAIAMTAAIQALNAELANESLPRVAVGVGVNTGRCVVGNMGSHRRLNYTALGDAVNLAARLESASKELGVTIVIGPETARQVGDRLPLKALGPIRVKGKQDAIDVFTVAG